MPKVGGNAEERPIIVEGEQVGWLSTPVRRPPFEFADRRFQEDQLRAGWIAGLAAIALSAIVAWFVARGLLTPVKRTLAAATRRLAEGEYSTRVPSTSNDEIGRLIDDFNRLGNTLEKNEALRRNFMADASHELKNTHCHPEGQAPRRSRMACARRRPTTSSRCSRKSNAWASS